MIMQPAYFNDISKPEPLSPKCLYYPSFSCQASSKRMICKSELNSFKSNLNMGNCAFKTANTSHDLSSTKQLGDQILLLLDCLVICYLFKAQFGLVIKLLSIRDQMSKHYAKVQAQKAIIEANISSIVSMTEFTAEKAKELNQMVLTKLVLRRLFKNQSSNPVVNTRCAYRYLIIAQTNKSLMSLLSTMTAKLEDSKKSLMLLDDLVFSVNNNAALTKTEQGILLQISKVSTSVYKNREKKICYKRFIAQKAKEKGLNIQGRSLQLRLFC